MTDLASNGSATATLDGFVEKNGTDRSALIPLLQDIQDTYGYLPADVLDDLAEKLETSPNEIYAVATFYSMFRFHKPGENRIQACQGTACHVRGAVKVIQKLQDELGIRPGQTTEDEVFDLERVACLGCCALAPVMAVNGKVHGSMTPKKISPILSKFQNKTKGNPT